MSLQYITITVHLHYQPGQKMQPPPHQAARAPATLRAVPPLRRPLELTHLAVVASHWSWGKGLPVDLNACMVMC